MPVAFNEPLSFLQRLTEYMEHTALVRRAACQPRALERMQVGQPCCREGVGRWAAALSGCDPL